MRGAPTRNKQYIVEEEKTEIVGMFVKPVLKWRRAVLEGLHIHVCELCYTIHCLYVTSQ